MEEEIQKIRKFENIDMAIKIYKEFRRFKNDGFIESIDPDFFFNLTDYILANSIPISVIEKKIKTLDGALDYIDIAEYSISTITDQIDVLQELLDERNNTDE